GTWGWADGDVFMYDGTVDDPDVGLQAGNYLSTVGQLAQGLGDVGVGAVGAGVVPEPATLGLMALGLAAMAVRRRRSR
ncbi:MAG: PEP-CTERM sorting domain-containing protein, partial [Planctomycetota bacterium]|nr:PEP-CTERM sorting domain-containing protein [Planctomycetota bacterium]